jgi:hypothetical protein
MGPHEGAWRRSPLSAGATAHAALQQSHSQRPRSGPYPLAMQGKMGDRAQTTRPDSEKRERGAKKKRDAAAAELELAVPKSRSKRGGAGGGLSVLDLEQVAGVAVTGAGWWWWLQAAARPGTGWEGCWAQQLWFLTATGAGRHVARVCQASALAAQGAACVGIAGRRARAQGGTRAAVRIRTRRARCTGRALRRRARLMRRCCPSSTRSLASSHR